MMARKFMVAFALASLAGGCKRDDMADQPRVKAQGAIAFFADGSGMRTPPAHTVPVDGSIEPETRSWLNPSTAPSYPFAITRTDVLRGQQQFNIYCANCHGEIGDGNGMVPERGFTRPPSYHSDRLRNATPTYFYNVMTIGIGAMYPFADRVSSDDRWRIAAYIRALQLSQDAPEIVKEGP